MKHLIILAGIVGAFLFALKFKGQQGSDLSDFINQKVNENSTHRPVINITKKTDILKINPENDLGNQPPKKLALIGLKAKKLIEKKVNCILDKSCIDADYLESEFASSNETPEHETLSKALKIQRLLIEKNQGSYLDQKTISKLLKIDNEQIRNEVLAIIHLSGLYQNEFIDYLRTSKTQYRETGDFNQVALLGLMVDGEEAQKAYLDLVKNFVSDSTIPFMSYYHQINDVTNASEDKKELFQLICSEHKLGPNEQKIIKNLYAINRIDSYENDCRN